MHAPLCPLCFVAELERTAHQFTSSIVRANQPLEPVLPRPAIGIGENEKLSPRTRDAAIPRSVREKRPSRLLEDCFGKFLLHDSTRVLVRRTVDDDDFEIAERLLAKPGE